MHRKIIRWLSLSTFGLALALGAPLTYGQSKGPGNPPAGFEKGKKEGWKDSDTPPGWKKGKKEGWKGGDKPPGLEKGTKAAPGKGKSGEAPKGPEEKAPVK